MSVLIGLIFWLVVVIIATRRERSLSKIDGRYSFLFGAVGLINIAQTQYTGEGRWWLLIVVPSTIFCLFVGAHQYFVCGDYSCPRHTEGRRESLIKDGNE